MISKILEGVKVLDLTRLLPGPYCTWILSRLGADVIKIEAPNDDDYSRFTPLFNLINFKKKSITLNLKKEIGKKIFLDLVSKSDIVVEGFRPGVMDKLGLGYDELRRYNDSVILCSISGYGQDGPYKDLPGHDINYISISGLLGINKAFDMPIIPGITIADLSGGLFGALSIISSLYSRERFGRGAYIDVSMTDVVTQFFVIMFEGNVNQTLLTSEIPFYNIYKTKDGKFISVGAIEEKFWRNFCSTIERDDFIDKQYDKSIISEISEIFSKKTLEEWLNLFKKEENMVTPVYLPDEVFNDPLIRYRKVFNKDDNILNLPVKFGERGDEDLQNIDDSDISSNKGPEKGEDTEKILKDLGYSKKDIEVLKEKEII
ncbi:MAG TPA: CoA transferase [Halobacteria archaeon]|nr:CoA transferase [Halobacteria archaeon]